MTYLINDIFYTLQGEGHWTGRPAVFVRFSRCNLWTGREEDRATAICQFCDTDFTHGRRYTQDELFSAICSYGHADMVVFTGGEPALQLDAGIINRLHEFNYFVAIETNGTRPLPHGLDWVCVSPKRDAPLVVERGDELKVVYPQLGIDLDQLGQLDFQHFWLSPMDGPDLKANTDAAVDYCMTHPQWRLSIQTHKLIGMP